MQNRHANVKTRQFTGLKLIYSLQKTKKEASQNGSTIVRLFVFSRLAPELEFTLFARVNEVNSKTLYVQSESLYKCTGG